MVERNGDIVVCISDYMVLGQFQGCLYGFNHLINEIKSQ